MGLDGTGTSKRRGLRSPFGVPTGEGKEGGRETEEGSLEFGDGRVGWVGLLWSDGGRGGTVKEVTTQGGKGRDQKLGRNFLLSPRRSVSIQEFDEEVKTWGVMGNTVSVIPRTLLSFGTNGSMVGEGKVKRRLWNLS